MSCHGQLVTLRWSAPAPLASLAGRLLFLLLVRPDQRDRYGDADVVHALGHRHCSRHVQQLLGTGLTTGGCRPTWNAPPRAGGPHPEHQTTGPAALLLLTRPASLAIRSTQARRSRSDALTLLVRQVTQAHGRHHRVLDRRRGTSPDEGVGAGAHRHAGRPADRHGAPHQRAGRAQDHRGADPRVHPRHRQGNRPVADRQAAVDHPDDTVRQVLFPVVPGGERTLRDLVAGYRHSGRPTGARAGRFGGTNPPEMQPQVVRLTAGIALPASLGEAVIGVRP
jgi:hypothetical protein